MAARLLPVVAFFVVMQYAVAAQRTVIDLICGTGADGRPIRPAIVAAQQAPWVRQSPGVLTPDYGGTVELSIAYSGGVPALRVFYGGQTGYIFDEFPRVETRTIDGTPVDFFRPSWPMTDFVDRFGLSVDHDGGQSGPIVIAPASFALGTSGFPAQFAFFSMRAMSRGIGSVPVVHVDDTAQYSSHVRG
jgi:hypothetical protein